MKIIEKHIVPVIDQKIRLQEYAATIFKSITSRSGIKKAVKREQILLNGKPAQTSDWIEEGQEIVLLQPPENNKKIFKLHLPVLFEDDFLAVIEKPAGYPTNGNYFKTIENALLFNLKPSSQLDKLAKPIPVHRLDNPTSGLLLIAKTLSIQTQLHQAFEEKKIQKSYIALTEGSLESEGKINSPIDGKKALTKFKVLEKFSTGKAEFSFVQLFPITGRTHQLRKHLSEKNCPIIGDVEYQSNFPIKRGILLQAYSLEFIHPKTEEHLIFSASISKKFNHFFHQQSINFNFSSLHSK